MRDGHLSAKDDDTFGAIAEWTEKNEQKAWRGVGWEQWSEWAPCTVSCGEGTQERSRYCLLQDGCRGFNKERRRCNMFACQGSVSPLNVENRRYYHPSRAQWTRVPGRETAWRLRPNSYLWLPAAELPFPAANFRKHFALLVTLRLDPKSKGEGTVFSLRSRRQQDTYLSVELGGLDAVKIVHSGRNGTQTILVPASLGDGNWHHLALGIQDDSSVRSYLDCHWVSTDILKRNALDTPDDADLVIGYLFSGDLEQLVIVPDPTAVAQQCSGTKEPSLDPLLEATRPHVIPARDRTSHWGRRNKPRKGVLLKKSSDTDLSTADVGKPIFAPSSPAPPESTWQDLDSEGSGSHPDSVDQYEVEWSEWTSCSVTCGTGQQTRSSRCVDAGGWLEMCLEAGAERTETRQCKMIPCSPSNGTRNNYTGHQCDCLNGGICHGKKKLCRCPQGFTGKHCENPSCHPKCLNGGVCTLPNTCSCPPLYHGNYCETPICDPICQNGGQCVAPQQCICPLSTSGNFCQNFTCRGGCLNGGICVGPDLCECQNNSTGPRCAEPVCDPSCENGATCASGNICICSEHTSGTRCQTK
ncbi:uncharacterized protein LOC142324503 isoform X2 [Lycorma delicatula]